MTIIPEQFQKPRRFDSYHAGWIASNGTLHYADSHCAFKPRGWKAANERFAKEQRAKRRAEGLPLRGTDRWGCRVWTPRNIDTYRWLSDRGFLRLEVCTGKQVTVEAYPNWGGGFEVVLTEAAAQSLCDLVHATKTPVLRLRNGWSKPLHTIQSEKIHNAHDILRAVV